MGMIGLTTETVSPPHEPDTTFVLRTALSPYECEWVKESAGQEAMGSLARAAGSGAIEAVFKAIDAGRETAEIVDDLNAKLDEDTDEDEESEDTDEDTEKAVRAQYDLDFAAVKLVKEWSYKDNGRKIPVKLRYVRLLDAKTRKWLHDKAWAAMRIHLPEDVLAGNS